MADMPILLYALGGCSVAVAGVVGVDADRLILAHLLPFDISKLDLCIYRNRMESISTDLILLHFFPLNTYGSGDGVAFFFLSNHQAWLGLFLGRTVSLEGWKADFSLLINIVKAAFVSIGGLWTLRGRIGFGLVVGNRLGYIGLGLDVGFGLDIGRFWLDIGFGLDIGRFWLDIGFRLGIGRLRWCYIGRFRFRSGIGDRLLDCCTEIEAGE